MNEYSFIFVKKKNTIGTTSRVFLNKKKVRHHVELICIFLFS